MYYRVAIQRQNHYDQRMNWRWVSTKLSSLQTLFQFLRSYNVGQQSHLRVFSSCKREDLEEQLLQENQGLGSSSEDATHFLRERLIHAPMVEQETAASELEGYQQRTSISVVPQIVISESNIPGNDLTGWSTSALERRRQELEQGSGGDHDETYCFVLPTALSLTLKWMSFLSKIQRGELEL